MPGSGYTAFVLRQRRFIAFGFVMTFISSFGQTFFIGVFGPSIQGEFGLSHTVWGLIYMAGTLGSALVLPWSGKLIDQVELQRYTIFVCLILIIACAFMSMTGGVATLVIAIFLLRHAGQGLISHVGVTSMSRYFTRERGRAIAIASVGYSAGEAVLPFLAVAAIGVIGWRWTYAGVSMLLLVGLIPATLWLLRGYPRTPRDDANGAGPVRGAGPDTAWTRGQVLKSAGFYLFLPGALAPSFILTAMFFHHLNLADAKGWSHEWITGSYVIYAAVTTLAMLLAGSMIDRFGAARLVPFMLAPLILGMLLIWAFDGKWVVWPYMCLAGVNVALAHTATSAMWAEMYGVKYLGGIRSLVQSMGVLSTGLGPVTMGGLVDLGMAIDDVCLVFAGYALLGSVLLSAALRRQRNIQP